RFRPRVATATLEPSVLAPARYSLPSLNWLRFASDRVPVPEWPLEAMLDGAAAGGFTAVGLDRHTVARHIDAGGRVEGLGEQLKARGLRCTDVGVLPVGTPDVRAAAELLARMAA